MKQLHEKFEAGRQAAKAKEKERGSIQKYVEVTKYGGEYFVSSPVMGSGHR